MKEIKKNTSEKNVVGKLNNNEMRNLYGGADCRTYESDTSKPDLIKRGGIDHIGNNVKIRNI